MQPPCRRAYKQTRACAVSHKLIHAFHFAGVGRKCIEVIFAFYLTERVSRCDISLHSPVTGKSTATLLLLWKWWMLNSNSNFSLNKVVQRYNKALWLQIACFNQNTSQTLHLNIVQYDPTVISTSKLCMFTSFFLTQLTAIAALI